MDGRHRRLQQQHGAAEITAGQYSNDKLLSREHVSGNGIGAEGNGPSRSWTSDPTLISPRLDSKGFGREVLIRLGFYRRVKRFGKPFS